MRIISIIASQNAKKMKLLKKHIMYFAVAYPCGSQRPDIHISKNIKELPPTMQFSFWEAIEMFAKNQKVKSYEEYKKDIK